MRLTTGIVASVFLGIALSSTAVAREPVSTKVVVILGESATDAEAEQLFGKKRWKALRDRVCFEKKAEAQASWCSYFYPPECEEFTEIIVEVPNPDPGGEPLIGTGTIANDCPDSDQAHDQMFADLVDAQVNCNDMGWEPSGQECENTW
ncbi:MAG: hypothetical protein KC912_17750 [Proteobacteria bacterium]|nr:hypothetical protein [Pseudomonadota bacterium]